MRVIKTTFKSATNTKGSHIVATTHGLFNRVRVGYHSEKDPYRTAAMTLAQQLGWYGTWVVGTLNNDVHVWVCLGQFATVTNGPYEEHMFILKAP